MCIRDRGGTVGTEPSGDPPLEHLEILLRENRIGEKRPTAPGVVVGAVENHPATATLREHRLPRIGQRHPLSFGHLQGGGEVGVSDRSRQVADRQLEDDLKDCLLYTSRCV